CTNPACPAQVFRWLTHFTSRGATDIDGLGERWCAVLLSRGLIADPADIYGLTREQLLELDRMGPALADKILRNIEASKQRPLSRLLFALGIRHVGSEIEKLHRAGVRMEDEERPRTRAGPLSGKTFVITGSLESMPRSRAEELLRSLGAKTADSVTKKTDYLVVGEAPGSKLQKAQQYDTKLLDEAALLSLLEENGVKTA